MSAPLTSDARAALAKAMSPFQGLTFPKAPTARYVAPAYTQRPTVSDHVRDRNLAKLAGWVEAQRDLAATQADPDAFLMAQHDHLGRLMSKLGGGCAAAFRGLTAFDLGEAQTALIAPLIRAKRIAA